MNHQGGPGPGAALVFIGVFLAVAAVKVVATVREQVSGMAQDIADASGDWGTVLGIVAGVAAVVALAVVVGFLGLDVVAAVLRRRPTQPTRGGAPRRPATAGTSTTVAEQIDRVGIDTWLRTTWTRIIAGPVPDPGNPGRVLTLHELPADLGPVRLLVAENGSPDPDGSLRRYGVPVPSTVADPIGAAAWTYGVPPEVYRSTVRRT